MVWIIKLLPVNAVVLALVAKSAHCTFAAVVFAVVALLWIGEAEVDEDAVVVEIW